MLHVLEHKLNNLIMMKMINNGKYKVKSNNSNIVPDKQWLERPRNQWDDFKHLLKKKK